MDLTVFAAGVDVDGGTLLCEDAKTLIVKKLEMTESEYSKTNRTEAFGKPKAEIITPELEGENSQHWGVLNSFAAAILRGEPLIADGREGINGLMISNAMHLSAWTGKPVTLPFDENEYKTLLMEHVKTSRRKVAVASDTVADLSNTYGSK